MALSKEKLQKEGKINARLLRLGRILLLTPTELFDILINDEDLIVEVKGDYLGKYLNVKELSK